MYLNEIYEATPSNFPLEQSFPADTFNITELETEELPDKGEAILLESEVIFLRPQPETFNCPFCRCENLAQAIVCVSCRTMLTLSDLEMILSHTGADWEILRQAVERMETNRLTGQSAAEELKTLAIGYINLKNFRQALCCLRQASETHPNDVILQAQTNALNIRLNEIEQQQNIHDSMPKNRTILIVDDSETIRQLVSAKLAKSGHNVLCAVDGVDALEKINASVPDLVLLDAALPKLDGYQVCKLIRNNYSTKDVPVVMISDKDGFFDKVRGRLAGTTGYIIKPFGPERLMRTVESYIA